MQVEQLAIHGVQSVQFCLAQQRTGDSTAGAAKATLLVMPTVTARTILAMLSCIFDR